MLQLIRLWVVIFVSVLENWIAFCGLIMEMVLNNEDHAQSVGLGLGLGSPSYSIDNPRTNPIPIRACMQGPPDGAANREGGRKVRHGVIVGIPNETHK